MLLVKFVRSLTVVALLGAPLFSIRADVPIPRVLINEIQWMGSPSSSSDEWVELRNVEPQAVDLSGWKIIRLSSGSDVTMVTLPPGSSIEAGGFFLIANFPETSSSSELAIRPDVVDPSVSLLNSGLRLQLVDAADRVVDLADDGSGAPLGGTYVSGEVYASMARNGLGADGTLKSSWHTSTVSQNLKTGSRVAGTPRDPNENVLPLVPQFSPQRATLGSPVTFDASDAFDPDGDAVMVEWDFGDGTKSAELAPAHTYQAVGTYRVVLTVTDGKAAASAECVVVIDPVAASEPSNAGRIVLSELWPNPPGADDAEFIELHAPDGDVDLSSWQIQDAGSSKYIFPDGTIITSGTYVALERTVTKIALNNSEETVRVVRPDGSAADSVSYTDAEEGAAWSLVGTEWVWSVRPTPGSVNVYQRLNHVPSAKFSVAPNADKRRVGQPVVFDGSDSEDADGDALRMTWTFGDGQTAVGTRVEHAYESDGTFAVELEVKDADGATDRIARDVSVQPALKGRTAGTKGNVKGVEIVTSLPDVKTASSSTAVEVSGWVSAPPGILGNNLFYLTDGTSGIAVQSNVAMPKLKTGDALTVRGVKRTKSGEAYILVEDIKGFVLGTERELKLPAAAPVTAESLEASSAGLLVVAEGEVVSLSGSRFTLDDGTAEIAAYVKTTTGFKRPAMRSGDRVRVVGIVSMGSSGLRILPRFESDISVIAAAAEAGSAPVVVPPNAKPPFWAYGLVLLVAAAGYVAAVRKRTGAAG